MIIKCLGWLFLYYLKSTLYSRSDSAQGFKERVKTIPPRGERAEGVVASGFSPFAPCINGCIGASTIRGKDKDSSATAESDFFAN